MKKIYPQNERLKHQYQTFLRHTGGLDQKTINKIFTALRQFEESTGCKPFKRFKIDQAVSFKDWLYTSRNQRTGKPLSLATINSTLRSVRDFIKWLSVQPGYKTAIPPNAWQYFRQPRKDARAAQKSAPRQVPSVDQVRRAFDAMPSATTIQKRDKALMAFLALTGARIAAVASLRIKHVDLDARHVFQDPREVNTKHAKAINTTFFPMGEDYVHVFGDYLKHLKKDLMFGPEDALFPKTRVIRGTNGFQASGLCRDPFATTGPLAKIVKDAFAAVQMPSYTPHTFRHMLALHGDKICETREAFKAWSQNLGHESVVTTVSAYMPVSDYTQRQIILGMAEG